MEIQSTTNMALTQVGARKQDVPASSGGASMDRSAGEQNGGVTAGALKDAAAAVNRELMMSGRELSFSVDEATGKTVLRVLHSTSGEVVRQIPGEAVLRIAALLREGGQVDSLGLDFQV